MTDIVQDGLPKPQRKWAMAVIALGMTMAVLDGAIANVALPTIARDLDVNPASSIWVVNAFQLAMTISLLAFASLGDLWGYKRTYTVGLAMFTVTSLICALADSFWTLVVARGLQGFSAAAITSVNTALLRITFPTRFLGRAMGINGLIIAVAAAAGPTVAAGILALAIRYQCAHRDLRFYPGIKIPSQKSGKSGRTTLRYRGCYYECGYFWLAHHRDRWVCSRYTLVYPGSRACRHVDCGVVFYTAAEASGLSSSSCRLAAQSHFFFVLINFRLFFYRPNVGLGFHSILFSAHPAFERGGNGIDADSLASGRNDRCSGSRTVDGPF